MRRLIDSRWGWLPRIAILPLGAVAITAALWWTAVAPSGQTAVALKAVAPLTATDLPTSTPTATPSALPTLQPTATSTLTPTPTPSPTSTPTRTPRPPTSTPTPTSTPSPTPTPLRPTPDGVQRVVRVPILMYHHISDPPPGADDIRVDLSVSPVRFAEQLHYLQQQGYQSITLNDLALHLTVGQALPDKPIILTFDDGYEDAYARAFPLLKHFGFSATFFLVTARIDAGDSEWLSWAQVEEMHAAGFKFEPHGYDHSDLRGRKPAFLVFQILASKGAIEARTGETCRFFAYPSGRYDRAVIDVLRSAHFWGAVLTAQGATHSAGDLFTLRRVRVHGGDDLDAFIRTLNLDW